MCRYRGVSVWGLVMLVDCDGMGPDGGSENAGLET